MTLSQRGLLALLGLIASIHAAPAAAPAPDAAGPSDQIGLGPPIYSGSWDLVQTPSEPTKEPENPDYPVPIPTPSDHISLNPPSYSVSWDLGTSAPTSTDYPENPEESEIPAPQPAPSNHISINPPSYSVSWDFPSSISATPSKTSDDGKPSSRSKTRRPTSSHAGPSKSKFSSVRSSTKKSSTVSPSTKQPTPTPSSSVKTTSPVYTPSSTKVTPTPSSSVRYTVTWDTPAPPSTKEPEYPDETDKPVVTPPLPLDSIGITPPKATVSWGKRQVESDPDATPEPQSPVEPEEPEPEPEEPEPEDPDWPEQPEIPGGPIILPPSVFPTPGNSIGIQPPKATVIWGKRQFEYDPEPTAEPEVPVEPEEPEWPEEPEEAEWPIDLPPWIVPKPSNSIGIQPPKATIIWGKRQAIPEITSYGFEHTAIIPSLIPLRPTSDVTWNKRQNDGEAPEEPVEDPVEDPIEDPIDDPIDLPDLPGLPTPTPTDEVSMQSPSATIIWGRRDANPDAATTMNDIDLVFPTNWPKPPSWGTKPTAPAYISWGKRDAAPEPTADAILNHRAAEVSKSCALTTTASRVRICPAIRCTVECPVYPLQGDEYELVDPADETDSVKRAELSEDKPVGCPITVTATKKCPFCSCPPKTLLPTLTPLLTLITSVVTPSPRPSKTTSTYCPPAVITISPPMPCDPPMCPDKKLPCDYNLPVPLERRGRMARRNIVVPQIATIEPIESTKTTATCKPSVTMTVAKLCPTYICVPWNQCDEAQVVR